MLPSASRRRSEICDPPCAAVVAEVPLLVVCSTIVEAIRRPRHYP